MDPVRGAELQRWPPVLPRAASLRVRVEYDVTALWFQSGVLQEVGGRQTSLPCPDHDHVDVHAGCNAAAPGPIPETELGASQAADGRDSVGP
jgi:hypothetical protein